MQPLAVFKGMTAPLPGESETARKATMTVWPDRVEIDHHGVMSRSASRGSETILAANIAAVDVKKGMLTRPEVVISVGGFAGSARFRVANAAEADRCREVLLHVMQQARNPAQPAPAQAAAPSAPAAGGGLTGQLAELAELHKAGVLTADEFAAAKARLLGS